MKQSSRKQLLTRWVIYLAGMTILAMGLTLNTKTGLGASAVTSVAHTLSLATGYTFGNITLVTYLVFIAAQFIIKGKDRNWLDLLQLAVSVIFTRFLDLFKAAVPYQSGNLPIDLLLLVLSIVLTGTGAAMSIGMELVPNPADGVVNALSHRTGKELGVCKSWFDVLNVTVSLVLGIFYGNPLLGIGIGTIASMLGIGRFISLFNRFFRKKLRTAAGLEEPAAVGTH